MWQSLFKGAPGGRLNPSLPFADTASTRAVLDKLAGVNLQLHHDVFRALESHGLSDIEANAAMQAVCVDAIRARPLQYLNTRMQRFVWFWVTPNGTRRPATPEVHLFQKPVEESVEPGEPEGTYADAAHWRWDAYFQGKLNWLWFNSAWLYLATAVLASCGLLVMAVRPSQRPIAAALAMLLFYFATMTAIGAPPEYRYRMILEPILIVILVQLFLPLPACGIPTFDSMRTKNGRPQ